MLGNLLMRGEHPRNLGREACLCLDLHPVSFIRIVWLIVSLISLLTEVYNTHNTLIYNLIE